MQVELTGKLGSGRGKERKGGEFLSFLDFYPSEQTGLYVRGHNSDMEIKLSH